MCRIIGYMGGLEAQGVLLTGLKMLGYRGYDSAGVSVLSEDKNQLGAAADYIARIYDEVKARPQYVIKKKTGFSP
jgi:glucosamine--fructose-6-phosphate aminotransferase (isomerizing)